MAHLQAQQLFYIGIHLLLILEQVTVLLLVIKSIKMDQLWWSQ